MELLAAWWKIQPQSTSEALKIKPFEGKGTYLLTTVMQNGGREFLERRLAREKEGVRKAEMLEILGMKEEAVEEFKKVLKTMQDVTGEKTRTASAETVVIGGVKTTQLLISDEDPSLSIEGEILRLETWLSMDNARDYALNYFSQETPSKKRKKDPSNTIQRIHTDSLSVRDFHEKFATTQTPVIIEGLNDTVTNGKPWDHQWLIEIAGQKKVPVKKSVTNSMEWGGLECAGCEKISELSNDSYLFDVSIPLYLEELNKHLTIPKYFANDFLPTPDRVGLYRDAWPSLFVAPSAGLSSKLHVDTFGSNFWMMCLSGQKKWIFYSTMDLPFLYPTYPLQGAFEPVFEVDPIEGVSLSAHPAYAHATPYEVILNPGDVIFVPAGMTHAVTNLTPSVAISGNFIDSSNLSCALSALSKNALYDAGSAALHEELSVSTLVHDFDVQHVPLAHLKVSPS
eukprot:TRINITY_DN1778_c0_g1_i1.p1 TRINITY_DN1778_c0_g1~~TRINITY_DN1778_c0_g1_i1.p1  ORF type:complete len:454 (+),score=63.28 TRINITY_DN1778_c0_g1_i1:56-1417(+)